MRRLLIGAVIAAASIPSSAFSSSILHIDGSETDADSVLSLSCSHCPDPQVTAATTYKVPVLKSGVQRIEYRNEDGKRNLIRIDKFLGGSPVATVSTEQVGFLAQMEAANKKIAAERIAAREQTEKAAKLEAENQQKIEKSNEASPGIDTEATTAAVNEDPAPAKFTPEKLQLRLK